MTFNDVESRFVSIQYREIKSDLPISYWSAIANQSCYLNWRGIPLQKDAIQIASTQQLIQELKPKTIIEFGSFKGGSALWLSDMQTLFVENGKLISIDIDLSAVDEHAGRDERIQFIQGDSNQIEKIFTPQMMSDFEHPILVIEDAHVNTIGILNYFHEHLLKEGDYFIIEDTNIDYNNACYDVWLQDYDLDYCEQKRLNLNQKIIYLTQWLLEKPDCYVVDTKYVDSFGIMNASKNWNSVIKKIRNTPL